MKRIRKFWREVIRPWWYAYEWLVIGGIAVTVVVLGCIGFRLQLLAENKPVERVDLVFRSFQLPDIKAKLQAVHCRTAPMLDWDEPLFVFTPEEMERLGRMEHERWMAEKQQAGWIPGAIHDAKARTHPGMVPYDDLPLEEQEKNLSAVRQIPSLLASLGFGVHRLPLLPDMIDRGSTRINRS